MKRPGIRERLRYAFDNFMARGTIALVIGLFAISSLIVVVIAVIATVTGAARDENLGFFSLLWRNLLRTLDPGTMGGDQGSALFLALMLAVTLGGIFVIASLIGVLSSGLEARLTELRKGRSRVLERGHTVILGWSQQVFAVLGELIEANANRTNAVVVVLADRDKVEMEDEIRARVGRPRGTRIVCRHGKPTDPDEIDIASVQSSRAIVVLSPDTDDPDADVVKTLLAICNDPDRRPDPYHVVAVLRSPDNVDVARIVGKDEVALVVVDDLISRITAQSCRQSGLSTVYTELLDFRGDEIYFTSERGLVGKTFGDSLSAYADSAVIGIDNETPVVNPPMDTPIGSGDKLIVISQDDDTIRFSAGDAEVGSELIRAPQPVETSPERTLVLGWNRRARATIAELDKYVAPGSEVCVVASNGDREVALANSAYHFMPGDTTDRSMLDGLSVGSFDHVIVLCDTDLDAQSADARTLMTLLHLRDIASHTGSSFSITSEMLDARNRVLGEVARADDFIVSDRLASLLIAQIAENKDLCSVFDRLFDAEGSELYLKPMDDYVTTGTPVDFYAVVEAARRRDEVAIGYRIAAQANDAERAYGVVVNPKKGAEVTFSERDRVIVLARD